MRPPNARRKPLAIAAALGLAASALVAGSAASANAASGRHHGGGSPGISVRPWGNVGGQPVNLYTLNSGRGMSVAITNFGATVQSIWVPDRRGHKVNVALGFPTLSD